MKHRNKTNAQPNHAINFSVPLQRIIFVVVKWEEKMTIWQKSKWKKQNTVPDRMNYSLSNGV